MVSLPWREQPFTKEEAEDLFMLMLEDDTEDAPWMVMGDLQYRSVTRLTRGLQYSVAEEARQGAEAARLEAEGARRQAEAARQRAEEERQQERERARSAEDEARRARAEANRLREELERLRGPRSPEP